MSKLDLTKVQSGYLSQEQINSNFTLIEQAVDNTLSRDGTTPNQMEAGLDMNGNSIYNTDRIETTSLRVGDYLITESLGEAEISFSPDAASISYDSSGSGLTTNDVQAAIDELDNNSVSNSDLTLHINNDQTHGAPSGERLIHSGDLGTAAYVDVEDLDSAALPDSVVQIEDPFPYGLDYTYNGDGPYWQAAGTKGIILDEPIRLGLDSTLATDSDIATLQIVRDADYTSSAGQSNVNSALRVGTKVGANAGAFEWAFLSQIGVDESNTGANTNSVAIYGQSHKTHPGQGVWGACFEIRDKNANPTGGSYGIEISDVSVGSDNNNARFGCTIVGFSDDGNITTKAEGFSLRPAAGDETAVRWKSPFKFTGRATDSVFNAREMDVTFADIAMRVPYSAQIVWDTNDTNFSGTNYGKGTMYYQQSDTSFNFRVQERVGRTLFNIYSGRSSGVCSTINMYGKNSAGEDEAYGTINAWAQNNNSSFPRGVLNFNVQAGSSAVTGVSVDGTDASNPVWLRVSGFSKKVVVGAADSGGTGYRMLRVAN